MQPTIFTTPVIRHFFYLVSWIGLKLAGWKIEGQPPSEKKYVMIAVPHTTNWDFPVTLAICFVAGVKIYWMGKDSLFKGFLGPIMRFCGGIAINRQEKSNVVEQTVKAFKSAKELVVTIPVEGTRSEVGRWRTGFYYIALGAKVPIGLGYLDYARKAGGFGPTFFPTGDVDQDMVTLKEFYRGISGRYVWIDGKKQVVPRKKAAHRS